MQLRGAGSSDMVTAESKSDSPSTQATGRLLYSNPSRPQDRPAQPVEEIPDLLKTAGSCTEGACGADPNDLFAANWHDWLLARDHGCTGTGSAGTSSPRPELPEGYGPEQHLGRSHWHPEGGFGMVVADVRHVPGQRKPLRQRQRKKPPRAPPAEEWRRRVAALLLRCLAPPAAAAAAAAAPWAWSSEGPYFEPAHFHAAPGPLGPPSWPADAWRAAPWAAGASGPCAATTTCAADADAGWQARRDPAPQGGWPPPPRPSVAAHLNRLNCRPDSWAGQWNLAGSGTGWPWSGHPAR
jgi:hypothetical protein